MNVPILISALVSILFAEAASSPDIESARPGIDVLGYHFEIALSDSSNVIHGRAAVTVAFTDSVDSFFLDLVGQDAGATGMSVIATASGGSSAATPIPFEHVGQRLTLGTPGAKPGQVRTYTIEYQGVPADGLIISSNKFGDRTFFGDNWPNRARHWLPTVDHPSDKALVEWTVTAPAHYEAVANGALVDESVDQGMRKTTHWRTVAPIPTKLMVVGVARFAVERLGPIDGVEVQTWVYPQDRNPGFSEFRVAVPVLRFFISRIGDFPYAKLANVESTTRYGGMENASAIFYSEQIIGGWRANESTIAHEISHQWFGDSVTEGDWHHIWLSEGFATYFANLYWEHRYGADQMEDRLQAERRVIINYSRTHPEASLVDSTIEDPNKLLTPYAYQKGGWLLHMLRDEVGDEAFWAGIREYYRRFRDGNAVTADLRDVMEEASEKDLDFFFQQWAYHPGQPHLVGSWAGEAEKGLLHVELEQRQPTPFNVPLELGITTRSGERMVERVRINEPRHTFEIEVGEAVRLVDLDPRTKLLFTSEFQAQ